MIRDYIRTNITGGKAPLLKLQNNIDISENINDRIYKGLIIRKEQLNADRSFRNDISQTLDQQEDKSRKEVVMLIENLLAVFDKNASSTNPGPVPGELELFPNPATDHLVLRLKSPAQSPLTLHISGSDGRVLRQSAYSGPVTEIREDLSGLPPGLYFVVLRTADGLFSGRFVKG